MTLLSDWSYTKNVWARSPEDAADLVRADAMRHAPSATVEIIGVRQTSASRYTVEVHRVRVPEQETTR